MVFAVQITRWCIKQQQSLLRLALSGILTASSLMVQAQAPAPLKITLVAAIDEDGLNGQGNEIQVMTQTMVDEHNALFPKQPIDLNVVDSKGLTEETLLKQATGSLALVSCANTEECLVQANITKILQIPLVGVMSGDAALRGKNAASVYPLRAAHSTQLQRALQTLSSLRIKHVGVLVQANDFGKSLAAELTQLKLPTDVKIGVQQTIDAKTDIDALTKSLRNAGVTGVLFLSDDIPSTSRIVQRWKERKKLGALSYTPVLLHLNHLARPEYAERIAGYPAGAMFITVVPSPWGGKRAAQRDYQAMAQRRGLYRSSYESFEAYLNIVAVLRAVEKGKVNTAAKLDQFLRTNTINLGDMLLRLGDEKAAAALLDQSVMGLDGAFRH